MQDHLANENQRVLQGGARFLKKHALKAVGRVAKRAIGSILMHTAPVWGPVVLMLLLAVTAYMLIYGMAKEASMPGVSEQAKIGAFFDTEDKEIIQKNEHLFEEYKVVANTWDEGLTPEQRNQVIVHKFPWSVMAATDRVVNDESAWGIGKGVNPKPQAVFDALRPRFKWKNSTITTVTVTCSYEEPGPDGEGGGKTCTQSSEVKHVSLVTAADTLEGHFEYTYEWQTDVVSSGQDGGSVTVTREVLKQVIPPAVYYAPLKQFLASARGITDDSTFDIIKELALLYNQDYQFNHDLNQSLDYSTYQPIEGSNGWVWPTPSRHITSPFGPRSYPRSGFHHGIDVGATKPGVDGDSVVSMADGRVIQSGYDSIYGNFVAIDHGNGVISLYGHLNRRMVTVGDTVKKGDLIGIMGTTGFSTGTHLHFEMRLNGKAIDPKFYFQDILG